MALSNEQKTKLLQEALGLAQRASDLLDQCYLAHCQAVGIKPE